jgi:predicted O-methyltransferase YrrM
MMSLQRARYLARRLGQELWSGQPPPSQFPWQDDEFTTWLRFINPGMLIPGNVAMFAYCVDHLSSDAPIVEIGSFAGLSLNHIIHLLRKRGRKNKVFSVDKWVFENADFSGRIGESCVRFDVYREHVIDTFRKNVELFSSDRLPHHIQANSDEFFSAWRSGKTVTDFFGHTVTLGGQIAFAYIDGAHTYEQTLKDFENVDENLVPGGFIVFDDSSDDGPFGSTAAAKLAASKSNYRLIGKNPNYAIQKTED